MAGRTRFFALTAALLGSTAALAAWSARRPRTNPSPKAKPKAEVKAKPEPRRRVPADDPGWRWRKTCRRLVFAGLLAASAAISVWAAHQETRLGETTVLVAGFGVLAAALWAVAWWRGAWVWGGDFGQLTFSMLGLAVLALSGSGLVTELVLTHRGALTQIEVAPASPGHPVPLVLPGGSTPLRGDLRGMVETVPGERFTVAHDRGRFVRPMLPEDVNPSLGTVFFLVGAGLLGVTVLGFGFPLDWPRWGPPDEPAAA
ncbi:hypothetical protein SAMN05421837_110156 [Amycolatopsis pretoriensis]|uniref:Uncharacterized protein n=1 Tax=Amycolatopsis pretoriensis TaxID=218821 RepID=A0A1H5RFX0_9PSEU|nr:hypothetical protein [Amycolatopsis pretoriensis]SEF36401.1 hypothetical protein SAMN05421837_110156 [Amycolatopsis pretoriensis]